MNRTHAAIAALSAALLLLGGCAGQRRVGGSISNAPEVEGFRVELREVALSAKRGFNTPSQSFSAPRGAATITIGLALLDSSNPGRLLRVRPDSAITSVRGGDNTELLDAEVWFGTRTHGNASHVTTGAAYTVEASPRTFSVPVNVGRLPATLGRVAGHLNLEVVTAEATRVMPLPAVGEAADAGDSLRLLVSALELDESTGAPRLAVVELTSPNPAATGDVPPAVNTVELIDEGGTTLAILQRREEYALADTIKRRYVLEEQRHYSGSRPAPARAPTGVRIRLYSAVAPLRVPFEWGPIPITDAAE